MRARLGRLLSPNMVEEVVAGKLDMSRAGERREVAVMFTDLRGFTGISERLDATAVTAMLNEFFEVMVDVLFAHGGTLDKYMGDAIMALFGVPKPAPDAALVAVRCGLAMQQALRGLNRVRFARGEPPLRLGVGINYGEAVWGALGSQKTMDYTAIGDSVNTASRLCAAAGPGQVLVSRSVHDAVAGTVLLNELPPMMLRGKAEPVAVWEVRDPGEGADDAP
jgi:adenylate cyclase